MAQNIGTLVSAAIRPNDEFDPIATAYGNEIKGGLHSYETLGEIHTIINSRREWGMLASVYNEGDNNGTYQLRYDYYNTDITDNSNWFKTSIDLKSTKEWVDSVISILSVEPTLSPDNGDRYLLGITSSVTPSGAQWIGIAATTIVEYNTNGTWDITYPTNGMTVRDDSNNNIIYKYQGTFPNGEWKLERITNIFYIEPSSFNGITYSTTTSPKFTSYTNDLIFLTKFFIPNIGSVSLDINGLGYKSIKIATNSGLRDLILSDINTSSIYSLSYNGTYFQLTKPFPNDAYNIEFYIATGETMTVGDSDQYWVYGDLTIAGTMVNYGKIIVANGGIILEGTGTLDNQGDGEVILVDLFNTPTFNTTSTIQISSQMTLTGASVSATIVSNSITTDLLDTVGSVTSGYILSNDGAGSFQWITPNIDTNSSLFYNIGGTVSATNSTTGIYRTGSLNIGSGTVSGSNRFVVSSTTGSVSFVVDNGGNVLINSATAIAGSKLFIASSATNSTIGSNVMLDLYNSDNTDYGSLSEISFSNQGQPYASQPYDVRHRYAFISGYMNSSNNSQSSGGIKFSTIATNGASIVTSLVVAPNGSVYNTSRGTNNTLYGLDSLLVSSGNYNTAFGQLSLTSNTTGEYNTAVGYNSLQANTIGSYNTALGDGSLYSNTTGVNNVAVGMNSLAWNTTGYANTAIGLNSLNWNSTGFYNTAIGVGSLRSNTSGKYNTAIGNDSLETNMTGYNNVAVGMNSLAWNTTGVQNTAIGFESLKFNTTGSLNTAIGNYSLYSNITGSYNTAVGYQAIISNTTGQQNTAIGNNSLYYNTTGYQNTAIGQESLYYNTTGSENTALGYQALYSNTTSVFTLGTITPGSGYVPGTYSSVQLIYATGSTAVTYPTATIVVGSGGTVSSVTLVNPGTGFKDSTTVMSVNNSSVGGTGSGFLITVSSILSGSQNTAVGFQSSYNNIIGLNNTSIGYQSLFSNTTGSQNTVIGVQALYSNTTGYYNDAFGAGALQFNTTGVYNAAFGEQSLFNNINGNYNIAIGAYSLISNISGENNTAIGLESLYSNTTGQLNVAIGRQTLLSNTTGYNNMALGYQSLKLNTTGEYNIGIGYQTLYSNTTGGLNTTLGGQALRSNIGGSNNTALGYQAGFLIAGSFSGATNSNNSVFIGFDTRPSTGNNTNEIVIGYGATGSGSNSVTLGNSDIIKTQLRGRLNISNVVEYADNATALSNSLVIGDVYRTGDLLKIVH